MSRRAVDSGEFQVHYLGSSAELAALRRALEARGAVTRARLTPAVRVVVADPGVPADHPTLLAAHELGIEVLTTAEATERLLASVN
jgi:hypothetical protein